VFQAACYAFHMCVHPLSSLMEGCMGVFGGWQCPCPLAEVVVLLQTCFAGTDPQSWWSGTFDRTTLPPYACVRGCCLFVRGCVRVPAEVLGGTHTAVESCATPWQWHAVGASGRTLQLWGFVACCWCGNPLCHGDI
jgi:hypothetical protein